MLTICIPTYNRASLLEERLAEIVPQICNRNDVQLCICDDGSTDDTFQVIRKYQDHIWQSYKAPYNMGLGRNMLHAFEKAKTGWLWTLGDDDPVRENAVSIAVAAISKNENVLAINFNSEGGVNACVENISNLSSYLKSREITDILFMSSNLYNMNILAPHLKVFGQALGSIGPHLALLLRALECSGSSMLFLPESLTNNHLRQQRWSSMELASGLSLMASFIRDLELRAKVACSAFRSTRWMLMYGLREVSCKRDFMEWKRSVTMINAICRAYGGSFLPSFLERPSKRLLVQVLQIASIILCPYFILEDKIASLRSKRGGEAIRHDNQ